MIPLIVLNIVVVVGSFIYFKNVIKKDYALKLNLTNQSIKELKEKTDKKIFIIKQKVFLSKEEENKEYIKYIDNFLSNQYDDIEKNLKSKLKNNVDLAYEDINFFYQKNHKRIAKKLIKKDIKEFLVQKKVHNYKGLIFINDFKSNHILLCDMRNLDANYIDADFRVVVLEEIQKVRRRGEGFVYTRDAKTKKNEIIFVKNLNFYGWYIGSSAFLDDAILDFKKEVLKKAQNLFIGKHNFLILVDKNKKIMFEKNTNRSIINSISNLKKDISIKTKDYYYNVKYNDKLQLYIVYGFTL